MTDKERFLNLENLEEYKKIKNELNLDMNDGEILKHAHALILKDENYVVAKSKK